MADFDKSCDPEKKLVWGLMSNSVDGRISFEEFRVKLLTSVGPLDVTEITLKQNLIHGGLCTRGGVVEKILTRLNIID